MEVSKTERMLRLPVVLVKTGRGRASLYADIKAGLFVRGVAISAQSKAWPDNEVDAINAARIAGKSEDEIRELVRQLEAQRQAAAA